MADISCEPAALLALSRCFQCMDTVQLEAVKTYLLAVIAGVEDQSVEDLLAQAKCFQCLDKDTAQHLQNWLLCQIVNAS